MGARVSRRQPQRLVSSWIGSLGFETETSIPNCHENKLALNVSRCNIRHHSNRLSEGFFPFPHPNKRHPNRCIQRNRRWFGLLFGHRLWNVDGRCYDSCANGRIDGYSGIHCPNHFIRMGPTSRSHVQVSHCGRRHVRRSLHQ